MSTVKIRKYMYAYILRTCGCVLFL